MKKKKIKFNSRFFYAAASIMLAAVIAFIAIPTVTSATNGKATVVRVAASIKRGSQIELGDVVPTEVGAFNLPDNIAIEMEDVIGKYAAADLEPGDYVLATKVSEYPISSDVSLNQIPSGKLAYSVTIKTLASGLSDKLQKNDVIRLYHYKDQAQEFPELQFVKVLAVSDSKGQDIDYTEEQGDEDDPQQTAAITVLASPEQALLLTKLENDGVLQAALVSRGDDKLSAKLLQQQDDDIKQMQEKAAKAVEDAKKKAKEKEKAQADETKS